MSRHSKNSTASSVFTYAERQKLKEYGTITQRVGTDSQKPFEYCCICLHVVVEPKACDQGHMFCNDCIIENLVAQKKKNEALQARWEKEQQIVQSRKKEEEAKALELKAEKFEKTTLDFKLSEAVKVNNPFADTDPKKEKGQIIENIKNMDLPPEDKAGFIKGNFWMPENSSSVDDFLKERPSNKLLCPGDQKHSIKSKNLIKLKIDEADKLLACWVCKKELKFQKIVAISKCGHVMCKKCEEITCSKSEKCAVCNVSYKKDEVIKIQEGQSGFASHNSVETKKYTHSFVG